MATRISKATRAYVALFALMSLVGYWAAWRSHTNFPGVAVLGSFIVLAFLLDQGGSNLRDGAHGSVSFIIHLAAGLLFGGFWGGLVAGIGSGADTAVKRAPLIKVVFNFAQRSVAVIVAHALYSGLGGHTPPSYIGADSAIRGGALETDLPLFFVFAAAYFAINTVAVAGAVAISTQRPFREIWVANHRGALGYDVGASSMSLLVAWLFVRSQHAFGFGPFGLLAVIVPIVVVRHIYGMYHKLQDSGRELLEVMVKAIEARDPYTSGHSIRVAALSKSIAQAQGLSASLVESISTAALLHDVGKIHEEFAPLLRKEARLSPDEEALLQTHAVKSAELVGIISNFRGIITEAVRSHHERWDGKGYPDGISLDQIPIGARIIAISDTIDAMTTDRPYRKAKSIDAAFAEIERCRGTQFDPQLADLVVSSVSIRRVANGASQVPAVLSKPAEATGGSVRVRRQNSGFWRARRV